MVTLLAATVQQVWETAVADSRGRSELERIVDIDGDPVLFGDAVFAVSYQGNVGAVGLRSGNPLWRREMSSSAGLAVDNNNVYVTDSDSNVWAVSSSGGSSVWKQEGLAARSLSAPAAVGSGVVVGDLEGYLHLLAAGSQRAEEDACQDDACGM
jgi:outer membrane protein assembly factor BamB